MTKNRIRNIQYRRLSIEGLEQRTMLAGNVLASVNGQTLFLRGNNLDNGVVITQTGAANFLVTGIPALGSETPTTVNGGTAFSANNVRNFEFDLLDGNDVLGIGNNTAFLAALAAEAGGAATPSAGVTADAVHISGYANIRMGTGNDAVGIQLTTLSAVLIQTGAGSDAIAVEAASEGVLTILSDWGDQQTDGADMVRVRGVILTGPMCVNTLAGNDIVNISDVSASYISVIPGVGWTIPGVTDNDSVSGSTLSSKGSVEVIALTGDDSISLDSVVANNIFVDAGIGNDVVVLSGGTNVKTATILGQAGNDHIDMFGVAISIHLLIDGGNGHDGIHLYDGDAGAITILAAAGDDGVFLSKTRVRNNLLIDMGIGNDAAGNDLLFGLLGGLTLSGVRVDKIFTAFLGDGNDTLTETGVTAGVGSAVFGGAGADTLNKGSGNSAHIKPYGFENVFP